jgi:phosphate transport system substrate-binding protein
MKYYILLMILLLSTACGNRFHSAVIVAGSTSVQPYAELLVEEYVLLHPDGEVDVQGGGSSAGITAAESGTADIGMSSRNLSEKESHMWQIEIAKDGLAIIVHPGNAVRDLTFEQIQDIYSGNITHWSELGGKENKIHIIAREEGSGTRSAFDELVMGEKRVSPRAIIQDSNGSVRQLVSLDENAIGFISLGLVDTDMVAAVSIDGVPATFESVRANQYTLYRPFLFVLNGPPDGEANQFVDFVLSEKGQNILINEGLIPVKGYE